jgi:hypothetical protein
MPKTQLMVINRWQGDFSRKQQNNDQNVDIKFSAHDTFID